jgi:hypothetical protein
MHIHTQTEKQLNTRWGTLNSQKSKKAASSSSSSALRPSSDVMVVETDLMRMVTELLSVLVVTELLSVVVVTSIPVLHLLNPYTALPRLALRQQRSQSSTPICLQLLNQARLT